MGLPFTLQKATQAELAKIVRASTSPVSMVFRARIILLAAEGKSHPIIAKELNTTLATIRKWIRRFNRNQEIASLDDADRSGRPHVIPAIAKCEVMKFACSDIKTIGLVQGNVWTIKDLQYCVERSTGIVVSKSEIGRILHHSDLKPHKVKMWLHSPDPLFQ